MAEKKYLDKQGLTTYDDAQKQRFNSVNSSISDVNSEVDSMNERITKIETSGTSGGSAPLIIVAHCTSGYNTHTITATSDVDGSIATATVSDGKAILKVNMPGNYKITNDFNENTAEVTVGEPLKGDVNFSEFHATINVTIPQILVGETIEASDDKGHSVEKKADSTTVELTVIYAGTWNVGVKGNSYVTKQSQTISEEGETKSVTLTVASTGVPYIKVTLAEEFSGETVTCTKGETVQTKKANGTSVEFLLNETGQYDIALQSQPTIKKTVNVESAKEFTTTLTTADTTVPILTVTSKAEDNGKTIKVSKDQYNFEKELAGQKATFILPETGTWTVKCDDYPEITKTVNCDSAKVYKCAYRALIFGFTVDNSNSTPGTRVEYTDDAVGLNPAKMNSGSFSWGDWKDKFFNEKNHVYRVSGNGTIGKQVKDDNYAQFVDGGDSAITGSGHSDNFMASIPTVWVYRGMSGSKRIVKISDEQVDESYKAYAHTNESGEVLDFIYWPAFRGSDVNGTMRSISGQKLMASKTAEQEIQAATKNGSRWHTFDWADYQLRNDLLTLMFKTTDLQTALGKGYSDSSNSATLNTGSLITRGAFWGDQTGKSEVKAFHCEAPWGNQYLRIAGCVTDANKKMKVKMTRPYNTTGSGYTTVSPDCVTSSGYMSAGTETEYGLIPTGVSGSESTYECDYFYIGANCYACVGGAWSDAGGCGPWYLHVRYAASGADGSVGSALSLK